MEHSHHLVFCFRDVIWEKKKSNLTAPNSDWRGKAKAPFYPSTELLYMHDFTLSP